MKLKNLFYPIIVAYIFLVLLVSSFVVKVALQGDNNDDYIRKIAAMLHS